MLNEIEQKALAYLRGRNGKPQKELPHRKGTKKLEFFYENGMALIAVLESEAPLARDIRKQLAAMLKPQGVSSHELIVKQRPGRPAGGVTASVRAYRFKKAVEDRLAGDDGALAAKNLKQAIRDVADAEGIGFESVKKAYQSAKVSQKIVEAALERRGADVPETEMIFTDTRERHEG